MTETIRHHALEEGVHHLELDRPRFRNALGQREYASLANKLDRLRTDACKAIVLSGSGPSFCAGNDLAEFETAWPQPPHGPVYAFLAALNACPCPVIAAIQGAAVGIGATLLLHCDVVLAQREAFLQFPFVRLGITVEGGSSLLLPARIGHLRAMDLLLTGRRVPADEALRLGLLTEVVDGNAVECALERAREIAGFHAPAVRATKRRFRAWEAEAVPRVFEDEIRTINELIMQRRSASGA